MQPIGRIAYVHAGPVNVRVFLLVLGFPRRCYMKWIVIWLFVMLVLVAAVAGNGGF